MVYVTTLPCKILILSAVLHTLPSAWGKSDNMGVTQSSGGLGDGSPPVGSRGEVPVGGLGTSSPRS